MTDAIGRGDYELHADLSGLKRDLQGADKAIADSGKTAETAFGDSGSKAGALFSKATSAGFRVVSAGAAAAFAVAAKGTIDLTNVTAQYRKETGASAEEAKRAGAAINAMSGRNVQSLEEIGSTLAKVHTDLGLTGDAAEKSTEGFLRFARATGQDSTAAVSAFDDILDGFGLTANDAQGIMDKLIVSHQRYGGSIEANQAALAGMAPQLKALNLNVDDGIGLLNLFASSGLDAATGQKALNSAIKNLPPGTNLNDFVAELSSIEDPAARAARASEIFGSKAGPQLANAIKPGVGAIKDFEVSAEDAAGATDKANEALDSSFGAQIQAKIRAVSAAIRGVAQDWSPVVTGAGAAASAISAIAGPEVIGNVAGKLKDALTGPIGDAFASGARKAGDVLVGAMSGIGQAAGNALSDGMVTVWEGAGGTVIGNTIASRFEVMLDPMQNSRIAAAARGGAGRLAVLFATAFGAVSGLAESVGGAIATAIGASPAGAAVRAAVMASSTQAAVLWAGTFGTAVTAALIAAPVVIPVTLALATGGSPSDPVKGIRDWLSEVWHNATGGPIFDLSIESMASAKNKATTQAAFGQLVQAGVNAFDTGLSALKQAAERRSSEAGTAVSAFGTVVASQAERTKDSITVMSRAFGNFSDDLRGLANEAISGYFDPIKQQDRLLAISHEEAQARAVRASKTATREEKDAALAQLHNLRGERLSIMADLAASGRLSQSQQASLLRTLQSMYRSSTGDAKAKIGELIAKIKGIPTSHTTNVKLTGDQTAAQRLDILWRKLHNLPTSKVINVTTVERTSRVASQVRQHGGPVDFGKLYRVGERGEEWFVPWRNGVIVPNDIVRTIRNLLRSTTPQAFAPMLAAGGGGGGRFEISGRIGIGLDAGSLAALRAAGYNEGAVAGLVARSVDAGALTSNLAHVVAMRTSGR